MKPAVDERAQKRDGAGRVASGVGHEPRMADLFSLVLVELGEAVHPAVGNAMRRRGVDDARRLRAERSRERHGFARGIVRQAQHHDIGFSHQRLACGRILAQLRRNALDREPRLVLEPFPNLEPRRARFAVDEDDRARRRLELRGLRHHRHAAIRRSPGDAGCPGRSSPSSQRHRRRRRYCGCRDRSCRGRHRE